ncbi:MAG: hypothetical protein GY811_31260 [Myxococcales bacterium]|nr:hypothetical protein [Myxococcales bacterium]
MRVLVHVLVLSLLVALVGERDVWAQAEGDEGVALAGKQLERGEFEAAEKTIRRALLGVGNERAEAFRVLGLALFFQERLLEARAAFLDYLRSEPDAHLDPALVPPEAITLFEDVRARNLAEIESLRPRPKKKRYLLLNLVPGAGQRQNGDTTKGIIVAVGLGALLATNIGSYYWLKNKCDDVTRVCGDADEDDARGARDMQVVNQFSGVAAVGVYTYAVIDGFLGYRAAKRAESMRTRHHMGFDLLPTKEGARAQWSVEF